MYIKDFVVRETTLNEENGYIEDTGEIYNPRGKELWGILKGSAQGPMKWYYTTEEVFANLDRHGRED
jgi:hypothetical protein